MILQDNQITIETSGTTETRNFGMKQSRKAFAILSDLYSDKPLAIVRELGCNASDSMSASGKKDQPFHIHLPNTLEPWITFKDFGTGISHEDIYEVYTQYFASTKTESNDQIGCLGLGSKSPLCYTDNFTVTSIVDGTQRIYNIFFDEKGLPACGLMSTNFTSEGNGLAIQIPIKTTDLHTFEDAVRSAFRFFEVKPTISGGSIAWNDDVPTFEGKNWKSYESFGYDTTYAIMGGVAYKIDSDKVSYAHREMLRNTGLVMFFEMGELDFVPSREALSYDDDTIAAINAKIEYVKEDFAICYNQTIQNKPTILEALRAVYAFDRKFNFLDKSLRSKAATWQGLDISQPEIFTNGLVKNTGITQVYIKSYGRGKTRVSERISLDPNIVWYKDDLQRATLSRAKRYVIDNDKHIMIFSEDSHKEMIANGFDDSLFLLTSSLPKVARAVTTSRGSIPPFKIFRLCGVVWNSCDYDQNNLPAYFIEREGNNKDFDLSNDVVSCQDPYTLRDICNHYKIVIDEVVMVSKRGAVQLLKDGVEPFKKFIEEIVPISYSKDDVATYKKHFHHGSYIKEIVKNPTFKLLCDMNPFKVYMLAIDSVLKVYKNNVSFMKDGNSTGGTEVKLGTTDEFYHMMANKIGTYNWDISEILKIIYKFDRKDLTINQTSVTI